MIKFKFFTIFATLFAFFIISILYLLYLKAYYSTDKSSILIQYKRGTINKKYISKISRIKLNLKN